MAQFKGKIARTPRGSKKPRLAEKSLRSGKTSWRIEERLYPVYQTVKSGDEVFFCALVRQKEGESEGRSWEGLTIVGGGGRKRY